MDFNISLLDNVTDISLNSNFNYIFPPLFRYTRTFVILSIMANTKEV